MAARLAAFRSYALLSRRLFGAAKTVSFTQAQSSPKQTEIDFSGLPIGN
jgi:hypothetical protein